MRTRTLVQCGAVTLGIIGVLTAAPVGVAAQTRAEIADAARKASPRTAEEAAKFFEAEVAKKTAEAIARVYDPTKPPAACEENTLGSSGPAGALVESQLYAARTPRGVRRQAAVDAAGGDRVLQESRGGRRGGRSRHRPLRLERVRHGHVAESGPTEPAVRADHRSRQRKASSAVGGRAEAASRGPGRVRRAWIRRPPCRR